MRHAKLILVIAGILLFATTIHADFKAGFSGQQAWTDNGYLRNPTGWRLWASKSLSQKVSLEFSISGFDNNSRYVGVMYSFLPPPGTDTTREFIERSATVKLYGLGIAHALVDGSKMRLDILGGLAVADMFANQVGQTTGKSFRHSTGGFGAWLGVETTVKRFLYSPLALNLGYRYQAVGTPPPATDTFSPLTDISLSTVYLSLMGIW